MKKSLTLILLCISLSGIAQKVTLALNLKKDSTYYLKTSADLTIIQDINGTQQVITTRIKGDVTHKVISIKDTVYEMEVKYRSLGMHIEAAGKTIEFSSEDATGTNMVSKIINGMLNKSFTMFISNRGTVLEIKNLDNLYNGMFDAMPQASEAQKAQFKAQMQQSFGEKMIRTNFQEAFAVFPTLSVGPGDKWISNTNLEAAMGIVVKVKTTYTLQTVTDKAFLIKGDAVMVSSGNAALKEYNGIPMRFTNITGTETSSVKLDRVTGWISESTAHKSIKGTVQIPDGPKTPGGVSFPMSISGDVIINGK